MFEFLGDIDHFLQVWSNSVSKCFEVAYLDKKRKQVISILLQFSPQPLQIEKQNEHAKKLSPA